VNWYRYKYIAISYSIYISLVSIYIISLYIIDLDSIIVLTMRFCYCPRSGV